MTALYKILFICISLPIIISYNLLDHYYSNNVLDIHVTPCLGNIDCIPMLFDVNRVLQVPGNYRHINWHFDAVDSANLSNNGINEIIFKYGSIYKGQTEFKLHNKKITEFNIIINPYGLSTETLYNTILHEMSHIYLLAHSQYKDSIAGYKIDVLPNGHIEQSTQKLQLTNDDCLGLYAKLIYDIINIDYIYSLYLERMCDIFCSWTSHNYVLKEPDTPVSSISKYLPMFDEYTHNQIASDDYRQNPFNTIPFVSNPFNTNPFNTNPQAIINPRISYIENDYYENDDVDVSVLSTR